MRPNKNIIMTLLQKMRGAVSYAALRTHFNITEAEADRPNLWRLSHCLAELYYGKFITIYTTRHGRFARCA